MSGDFIQLKQATIAINSASQQEISIPAKINGMPQGAALVIKPVTSVKAVYKLTSDNVSDVVDKTVTDGFLADFNNYAYPNAIETFKATSLVSNYTPTKIRVVSDTAATGTFDVGFGYYA